MAPRTDPEWQRLPYTGPLDFDLLLGYFARRAITGVEAVDAAAETYRRTVSVDGSPGVLEIRRGGRGYLEARWPGGSAALLARVRRIFALDADPRQANKHLSLDPVLAPHVLARKGLRASGTWDPYETGVRAIVGQQVSVAGASTVTGRIVARVGTRFDTPHEGLTHVFPEPEALAGADLGKIGMPGARVAAVQAFAAAVADGAVDLSGDVELDPLVESIVAVRGLGPWTANYIALRMGHADAFPASDLGVRRAVVPGTVLTEREMTERAEPWRPYRALAALHLWLSETPHS